MSVVTTDSLFILHHHGHRHRRRRSSNYFKPVEKLQLGSKKPLSFNQSCTQTPNGRANARSRRYCPPKALSSTGAAVVETSDPSNVTFCGTFDLKRREKVGLCIYSLWNMYVRRNAWLSCFLMGSIEI